MSSDCTLKRNIRINFKTDVCKREAGFTMVELVVVIAVIAIIGGISVAFIRYPVQGYILAENNIALVDEADNTMRRMARDIRNALPNSVRVDASNRYVEFVPIVAAGRYRDSVGAGNAGNALDFDSPADSSFDVLGSPVTVSNGQQLVIYNMGISGADVYEGLNRRTITSSGTVSTIDFTPTSNPMPFPSPSNRFFVINGAVSYVCDLTNQQLLRYGEYALSTNQRTAFTGMTPRVLATDLSDCEIKYTEGLLQSSGVLSIILTLSKNNAVVRLVHLVNVVNSS